MSTLEPTPRTDADLDLPVWAGVVPLRLVAGDPVPDSEHPPTVDVPESVRSVAWRHA